ncbi:hypothetical protein HDE77_001401 [Rhodanobacter sp. MP7CTX1]|nr:hypothetical protein [Rhodanobacter sp. MP7CTX1]
MALSTPSRLLRSTPSQLFLLLPLRLALSLSLSHSVRPERSAAKSKGTRGAPFDFGPAGLRSGRTVGVNIMALSTPSRLLRSTPSQLFLLLPLRLALSLSLSLSLTVRPERSAAKSKGHSRRTLRLRPCGPTLRANGEGVGRGLRGGAERPGERVESAEGNAFSIARHSPPAPVA